MVKDEPDKDFNRLLRNFIIFAKFHLNKQIPSQNEQPQQLVHTKNTATRKR